MNCIIIIHTATALLLYAYRKCLQNVFFWVATSTVGLPRTRSLTIRQENQRERNLRNRVIVFLLTDRERWLNCWLLSSAIKTKTRSHSSRGGSRALLLMSRWARTTTTTKTGFSSVLYLRTDSAQKSPITYKIKELESVETDILLFVCN